MTYIVSWTLNSASQYPSVDDQYLITIVLWPTRVCEKQNKSWRLASWLGG